MSLFQWGHFNLHSGEKTWWRIDCDALSDSEIALFAKLIIDKTPTFNSVVGVDSHPGSSVHKLKQEADKYSSPFVNNDGKQRILIVDDVITTGSSMNQARSNLLLQASHLSEKYKPIIYGAVIFARGEYPDWVRPVFRLNND